MSRSFYCNLGLKTSREMSGCFFFQWRYFFAAKTLCYGASALKWTACRCILPDF